MFSINSHGGENFIKFRGKTVVLSEELNRALKESSIKKKFKEMLFILDTCEGLSLWDHVEVDNIYFVSSSKKDQKASSTDYNWDMMTPLSDKFHNLFFRKLKEIYDKKKFDLDLKELFIQMQNEKLYLDSDVSIIDRLERNIKFSDFFGNPNLKNNPNERLIKREEKSEAFLLELIKFLKILENEAIDEENFLGELYLTKQEIFESNNNLIENFHKIEKELSLLNKYAESTYHLGEENFKTFSEHDFLSRIFKKLEIFIFDSYFLSISFVILCIFIILLI